jgi:UDP-glucose/iron transport system permease protein
MPEVFTLSWLDVAIASLMMLGVLAVDRALRLALGKDIVIGSVRVFLQLYLVGFILKWVFALESALITIAILILMASIAGYNAVKRSKDISVGTAVTATGVIILAAFAAVGFGMAAVVHVKPWFNPQYVIPIAGMAMNGAMNGVALGINNLKNTVKAGVAPIECALCVGATGSQAIRPMVRQSIQQALIPTINGLMTAGIVQIPGMMTGQIIAGLPPTEAVRYQIMIFYMLALTTTIAAALSVVLYSRRFFTPAHQLIKLWDNNNG